MANHRTLYLFGDQTHDVQLKELVACRVNPVVEDFLQRAYDVIRSELHDLPRETRDALPRFTCLNDVLLYKPRGRRCVPLDMALTCMYQLGVFLVQGYPPHESDGQACVLGLCTGALAAAAVSCSRSTPELVPLAVDAVRVAFRTGVHAADVGQRLEPAAVEEGEDVRSWSVLVPGLAGAEAAVALFGDQTVSTCIPPLPRVGPHPTNT
jgi:hypothetical protein